MFHNKTNLLVLLELGEQFVGYFVTSSSSLLFLVHLRVLLEVVLLVFRTFLLAIVVGGEDVVFIVVHVYRFGLFAVGFFVIGLSVNK